MAEVRLSPGWATYLRVSDEDKQTPERSFAMQRQRIQEQLLSPSDIKFKTEYRDMLTGTTPNRKDYQHMLADAEAGCFSHLGLYRADRFGRNAAEGLQAATKLIGLGIKLRVANMPTLTPETPDGFFMFLISMGLAQREVDVLRLRTADGMEAKMRAGGWPHRAPEGYVNKERLIASGKYERWVELDPKLAQGLREAWEMLLTGRYTAAQICEELTRRGHTRSKQRPWAWTDPKTGRRKNASNRLYDIFHNPFHAGWVFSKRFGIPKGEVRGRWEPIVTTNEFERGLEILRRKNLQKSRYRSHSYLLRNLLWVRVNGRRYRMYCSTPTGRSQSYSYYITHAKPNGKKIHIPCEHIEGHIPAWLRNITVDIELLVPIRELYQTQLNNVATVNREEKLAALERRLSQFREEEAHLARLLITGKISEETFERLQGEWQEKRHNIQTEMADLEREAATCIDDLDAALALLERLYGLFRRLKEKEQAKLLQIIAKRIIVDVDGQVVDYELNSPFAFLHNLVNDLQSIDKPACGSDQTRLGPPNKTHLEPLSFDSEFSRLSTRVRR